MFRIVPNFENPNCKEVVDKSTVRHGNRKEQKDKALKDATNEKERGKIKRNDEVGGIWKA